MRLFFEEYAVIAWMTGVNVLRWVKLISESPFSNDSDNWKHDHSETRLTVLTLRT